MRRDAITNTLLGIAVVLNAVLVISLKHSGSNHPHPANTTIEKTAIETAKQSAAASEHLALSTRNAASTYVLNHPDAAEIAKKAGKSYQATSDVVTNVGALKKDDTSDDRNPAKIPAAESVPLATLLFMILLGAAAASLLAGRSRKSAAGSTTRPEQTSAAGFQLNYVPQGLGPRSESEANAPRRNKPLAPLPSFKDPVVPSPYESATPLAAEPKSNWLKMAQECADLFDELDRSADANSRSEAVDHVMCRLQEIFERSGVELIDHDQYYDRIRHQLDKSTRFPDNGEPIVATTSPGFAVGGKVLRRARVQLAEDVTISTSMDNEGRNE